MSSTSSARAIIVALLAALLAQGCDRFSAPQGPHTLVVDLAAVAKAVGKDDEISAALNRTKNQLNKQLHDLTDHLNTELADRKKDIDKQAGKGDQASYGRLSRENAQLQLDAMQEKLLLAFRKRVRQEASQVARQRGAFSVELAGADVLWFDPQADITDEVIARLRAEQDAPQQAPAQDATTEKETHKLNKLVDQVRKNP